MSDTARWTSQLVVMIPPKDRTRLDVLHKARKVSLGTVAREVIAAGLDVVEQSQSD